MGLRTALGTLAVSVLGLGAIVGVGASIKQALENRTEWELDNCEGNASLPACRALYAQAALPPDAGLQIDSGIEGEVTPIPGANLPEDFSIYMVDCGINPVTQDVSAYFGGAALPNANAVLNDNPLPTEAVPSALGLCDVTINDSEGNSLRTFETTAYPTPMVMYN